jgi:hypothetical protein
LTEINSGLRKAGRRFTMLMALKTGRSNNTYTRQSRFQTYISQTRQRRTLHTKNGAIFQKEMKIIKLYAPYVSAPNFINHTLKDLKAHIDSNTVVVGDFNTPLAPIDKSPKQNFNKEIIDLNNTIDQMELTDVYRIFPPAKAQYIFLSAAHGIFYKIDHILEHKASIKKIRLLKYLLYST